jgi:uncharacterized membrane protein
MGKSGVEAFRDGVIAIIITLMVLDLRIRSAGTWGALSPLTPVFLTYLLSFVSLGTYRSNHHHMMHLLPREGRWRHNRAV